MFLSLSVDPSSAAVVRNRSGQPHEEDLLIGGNLFLNSCDCFYMSTPPPFQAINFTLANRLQEDIS